MSESTDTPKSIPEHRWWKAEILDGWAVIHWSQQESDEREARYQIREWLKS